MMASRNVVFLGDEAQTTIVEAAGGIIHAGWSRKQALLLPAARRGSGMQWLQGVPV